MFYTFDVQGNASQRLDSNANTLDTFGFDAFGYRVGTDNSTDPYSGYGAQWGYYRDSETGLSLLGHRYYDYTQGRFLNRDPIGYAGGLNVYSYVGSNPLSFIDSSGTFAFLITGLIGAASGALIGAGFAWLHGGNFWEGAGKGALIGGVFGLTGGLAGAAIAGWLGGGVLGGIGGGIAGGVIGDASGQGVSLALGWQQQYDPYQTAYTGTLGGLAGAFVWRPANAAWQQTTHWGPPEVMDSGLREGDWVQLGGNNSFNRILTGTNFDNAVQSCTRGSALNYPPGWEAFKGLIGQRVYKP